MVSRNGLRHRLQRQTPAHVARGERVGKFRYVRSVPKTKCPFPVRSTDGILHPSQQPSVTYVFSALACDKASAFLSSVADTEESTRHTLDEMLSGLASRRRLHRMRFRVYVSDRSVALIWTPTVAV